MNGDGGDSGHRRREPRMWHADEERCRWLTANGCCQGVK
ncbi:uncharacterized protein G2W53_036337 [Senna tora]|uniref:Uncharacterized protein n=1 Tax=Senna tora TaxID=362788 RepID=A0A834T4T7_9FABA|nr:uncharacterized protein G2W53_036337 [Senna tora]